MTYTIYLSVLLFFVSIGQAYGQDGIVFIEGVLGSVVYGNKALKANDTIREDYYTFRNNLKFNTPDAEVRVYIPKKKNWETLSEATIHPLEVLFMFTRGVPTGQKDTVNHTMYRSLECSTRKYLDDMKQVATYFKGPKAYVNWGTDTIDLPANTILLNKTHYFSFIASYDTAKVELKIPYVRSAIVINPEKMFKAVTKNGYRLVTLPTKMVLVYHQPNSTDTIVPDFKMIYVPNVIRSFATQYTPEIIDKNIAMLVYGRDLDMTEVKLHKRILNLVKQEVKAK